MNWAMQISPTPYGNYEYQLRELFGNHLVAVIMSGNYSNEVATEYLSRLTHRFNTFIPLGALPGQEGFADDVKMLPAIPPAKGLESVLNWEVTTVNNIKGVKWYGVQEHFGGCDVLLHVVGYFGDEGLEYATKLCALMNDYCPLGTMPEQQQYLKDVAMWVQRRNLIKGK